jgi:hypothetical protein
MEVPHDLVEKFRSLGVNDPEGWAGSQVREGIPQLTRATILVEFAKVIEDAAAQALAAEHLPSEILGSTITAIRAATVVDDDLKKLLQFACTLAVFNVCTLLDGSRDIRTNPAGVSLSLAISYDDPMGTDDMTFGPADLALHESVGEVVTSVLGNEVYWS